jgi:hypothetical protein
MQRMELYQQIRPLGTIKSLFAFVFMVFFGFKTVAQNQSAVRFIKNKGQWNEVIRYRADIPGGYLVLKNQSLLHVFTDDQAQRRNHAAGWPRY